MQKLLRAVDNSSSEALRPAIKRLAGLLCCLLLLGAKSPTPFEIQGVQGEVLLNVQHRLRTIYKEAAHQLAPDELQNQVAKALYPYGYFNAIISIKTSATNDGALILITPGPRLFITSLRVSIIGEGAHNTELQQAQQNLPINVGQAFQNKNYEAAKNALSNAAERQGYLHASFETSTVLIDKAHNTADIVLLLNTGPRYYFGQIRFDPTYISPTLLHRFVPFKPGDPYSTEKILALNSNLSSSGYFNRVDVKPVLNAQQEVPIDVSMEPAPRVNYSVGAGYGTDTGPRGRLGLTVTPVNHAGHKFNAVAQGSFEENALQGQYIIPGSNPMTDHYGLNGGFTNLSYNAGRSNAILLGLSQQHAVSNYQQTVSLNGLNENYNYTGLPSVSETLVFPKGVVTWSKTSDPLFSPSGYNITLTAFGASNTLLSDVSLAEESIEAKVAITLDALRTRVYLHAIQGLTQINNINQLPLSLADLLGGADNLKGYSFNSIGPGQVLSYAGIQLQKETFHKLYLVGFFDCGDVYNPSIKDTKYDAGVGIMWISPVGPIKIAVAQAIDSSWHRIPDHSPKLVVNMGPDL